MARPGGSPFNVAIGLGRLGIPTGYWGKFSTDIFGQQLQHHLTGNGVDLRWLQTGPEPTTLAFVRLPPNGEPQYAFYGYQTADTQLAPPDLQVVDSELLALHFGSISLIREPGATILEQVMQQESGQRFCSLDPNIRPGLIPDRECYLSRFHQWLRWVTLVKVSQADLSWLYPNQSVAWITDYWFSLGVQCVVITFGCQGATGYTQTGTQRVAAQPIRVVDTIGAGDAFMSGLLASLYSQRCLDPPTPPELPALEQAITLGHQVAAFTCQRAGADPPWHSELLFQW